MSKVKVTSRSNVARRAQAGRRVRRLAADTVDRGRKQGAQSRLRILEATFELAHELGYQGTSISKVVQRSGLPASSVYWHFADKDALFAAMIQHSFEQWQAGLPKWAAPGKDRDRRAELGARIRSAIASIASNPEFWRLGLLLSLQRQPAARQARLLFKDIRRRVIDNMAAFWGHVLPAGYNRRAPDLPHLLARITMATADGLFVSAQIDRDCDFNLFADLLADMLEAVAARSDKS